jgi:membrane dipeptidase
VSELNARQATYRDWFSRHADPYQIVGSVSDARASRKANKFGVCFDIEGMNAVLGQPEVVRLYYDIGVGWMLILHHHQGRFLPRH